MKKHSKKKMKKRLRKARKKALRQQKSLIGLNKKAKMHSIKVEPVLVLAAQEMAPVLEGHDETTLARAKTHWFFGEWHQLTELDIDTLRTHPDRDRFALLIGSAHQQFGEHDKARKCIRIALDWGCPPRVVAQVLIAGVHNTLGRAATIKQDSSRIKRHFKSAVAAISTRDTALVSHARSVREMARMGLHKDVIGFLGTSFVTGTISANALSPSILAERVRVYERELDFIKSDLGSIRRVRSCNKSDAPVYSNDEGRFVIANAVDRIFSKNDLIDSIDSVLADSRYSSNELFDICLLLSDRFVRRKDNISALNYLAIASDYLSQDPAACSAQRSQLARYYFARGRIDEALDYLVENIENDENLSPGVQETVRARYRVIRAEQRAKHEHGHELLLGYLAKSFKAEVDKRPVMIEVGTTRERVPGQGSTAKIADYCLSSGIKFITIDMDPHNTAGASKLFASLPSDFEAINAKGEDYLRAYQESIDFIFLDAYDFDHGNHSDVRQTRYQKYLGNKIDDGECHRMHLDCVQSVEKKLAADGIVCIDDTWRDEAGNWTAKGTLAMPYLLSHGFELIEERNKAALLRRSKQQSR